MCHSSIKTVVFDHISLDKSLVYTRTKHGVRSVNSSTMTTPSEGSASASADAQVPVPSPSYGIQSNLPVSNRLDMSGNISENWKKWKQVWDWFEIASRLNEQENEYRVATFITCIGSEALEVYNGLPFEREEDNDEQGSGVNGEALHRTDKCYLREVLL